MTSGEALVTGPPRTMDNHDRGVGGIAWSDQSDLRGVNRRNSRVDFSRIS
jgi:hypothetical protein